MILAHRNDKVAAQRKDDDCTKRTHARVGDKSRHRGRDVRDLDLSLNNERHTLRLLCLRCQVQVGPEKTARNQS